MSEIFLARQPIFDARPELAGYELLFRGSNDAGAADFADNDGATSTVVINAFTELGLDGVVGNQRAWVNVSHDFIVSGLVRALPAHRVVLELLENESADEDLVAAVKALRGDGYKVALDDFTWTAESERLLPHVDTVKVEVLDRADADIAADVGYESEAAFNRAFKREFGAPPAQYRRRSRRAVLSR